MRSWFGSSGKICTTPFSLRIDRIACNAAELPIRPPPDVRWQERRTVSRVGLGALRTLSSSRVEGSHYPRRCYAEWMDRPLRTGDAAVADHEENPAVTGVSAESEILLFDLP